MNSEILSKINTKKLSILVSFICFGSIGAALVSQHFFDMQPCPWCILQRMIFILIGIASLGVYAVSNNKKSSLGLLGSISLLSTCGEVAALYQLLVASKSFDCKVSLAEKIIFWTDLNNLVPDVFGIFAMCGDANPLVFGIPYIYYSIFLFMAISSLAAFGILKTIKSN
jgi:disulfide bond formation protein DsbB